MIKMHIIVPYPELKRVVEKVIENHRFKERIEKSITVVPMEDLCSVKLKGSDVVIARGYAARQIALQGCEVPIIDITISGYDIFRSVKECMELYRPKKMAFVGFYSAFKEIEEFSSLLGCHLKVYKPKDYDQVDEVLRQAVRDGCDAVIGGQYVVSHAKKMRINSIVIKTGEEAVHFVIDEAVRTYDLLGQERIKTKMHEIITQSAKEGIIYVDHQKKIKVVNKVACSVLKIERETITDLENLPDFEKDCVLVMESGKEKNGQLKNLGEITISVDYTPVVDNNYVAGVVISFQNITNVQKLEGQIRKKLSEKGLCARNTFADVVYTSKIIEDTIEIAKKYAKSSSNIMLVGETGTGKEIFAQSIHNESTRQTGPFVAVNCAALTENLLESELFGYVEGAFTGAVKKGKMGLFELAHNGTLFLDEIGEISINMQSKLLRVLQEKEVRRIGDDKVISVDVRIVCATNKNLKSLVAKGLFRQDLLYRLDVLKIFIPPLRKREKDMEEIFQHMLRDITTQNQQNCPKITEEAKKVLLAYSFPGNIRELKNIAERVNVIRMGEEYISKADMEAAIFPDDVGEAAFLGILSQTFIREKDGDEENRVRAALLQSGGNQTKAAKILGIDRSTLWRKINKYGIK
ncbi:MAG: sigma 54-interacting transcriptional regulator [Anaerotignaceae bacterium]